MPDFEYKNPFNSAWVDDSLVFAMYREDGTHVGHVIGVTAFEALMNVLPYHGIGEPLIPSEDDQAANIHSILDVVRGKASTRYGCE